MENFNFFSFAQIWNKAFETENSREFKARDYLYASEIGGSTYDIVQKMRGILPTTPPNGRSLRKFQAGNTFEFIVKMALMQLGLYKESQDRVMAKHGDLLNVSGRLDFIIGGVINFDSLAKLKENLQLGDGLEHSLFCIAKGFSEWYKEYQKENGDIEIPNEIWELKTCSSMIYDMIEREGKAKVPHENQIYHYVFNHKSIRNGRIIYICKDDMRMQEFCVSAADERLKKQYFKGIANITEVYNQYKDVSIDLSTLCVSLHGKLNELKADENGDVREIMRVSKELRDAKVAAFNSNPPLDHLLICDMFTGLLSKNWKVEYSGYLTDYFYTDEDGFAVYFETPEQYRTHVLKACKVNSIMQRFWKNEKEGKADKNKITAKNQEWIDDLQNKFGYTFEDCYEFFKVRQMALLKQGIVLDEIED